jgi:hypothetical protein
LWWSAGFGPSPVDVRHRFLHFLARQDFSNQVEVLHRDDGCQVFAVAAHDYRAAPGDDLGEHSRVLLRRPRFVYADWFFEFGFFRSTGQFLTPASG